MDRNHKDKLELYESSESGFESSGQDEKTMSNMKIDTIFPLIGGLGTYQITELCILLVSCVLSAEPLYGNYVGFVQEHWCSVDELRNLPYEMQQNVSIPKTSDGEYSSCEYYPLNYSQYDLEDFLNWDRDVMFNGTSSVSCDAWVYDQSVYVVSMVNTWDLVCGDRWKVDLLATMLMFGLLLGSISSGVISDRFGRKISLMVMILLKIIGAGISLFAPSYPILVLGKIVSGAGFIGTYIVVFVIALERVDSQHRTLLGQIIAAVFALGTTLVSVFAFYVRDYNKLQIIMAAPYLLLISYGWLIPESPRWLLLQGRKSEAEDVIRRIAIINNKPLPDTFSFEDIPEKEEQKNASFFDLFRTRRIRRYSFIQFLIWFTANLLYYALTLNSGRLAGDVFMNTALLTLVEIPANFIVIFSMNNRYIMRKRTILISMLVGGIACLICVPLVLTEGESVVTTTMSIIGKAGATAGFNGMFIYTSEIYPTEVRNVGLGACSMVARVSGLLAPYAGGSLGDVWLPLPSLLFGILGTLSGLVVLGLPETYGRPLQETISEVENSERPLVTTYISEVFVDEEAPDGTDTKKNEGYGSIVSSVRL